MLLFCSFWTQSLKSLPKQGKNACEVLWFLYYRTIALCVCIWSTSWQLYLTVKIYYYKSTLKLLLHDFCTENRVSDEAFLKIKKINLIQIYCYCLTIAEMHPRFIKNEDCKDGLFHSQYKHRLQLRREKEKKKNLFLLHVHHFGFLVLDFPKSTRTHHMPLQVPAHRKQSPAAIELLHQASRAHIGWAKTCKNARVVFKHSYRRCTSAEEATMNSSFFCLGCLQQHRGKNTYTNM